MNLSTHTVQRVVSTIAAIDPGKVGMGWAIFDAVTEQLIECGLLEYPSMADVYTILGDVFDYHKPCAATIEIPQIYQQKKWKGNPNDLISVAIQAGAVGACVSVYAEPEFILPRKWKGTRPKDVDNKYTLSLLSDEELAVLKSSGCKKSKLHNIIDAIGIGLWCLKRR